MVAAFAGQAQADLRRCAETGKTGTAALEVRW
jgi:hypothetical protein